MNKQTIHSTMIEEIANEKRLLRTFSIQKEKNKPAFYVLPSYPWLQYAREHGRGLAVTTFDDIAQHILHAVGYSYIPLTELERSLFFQQFLRDESLFSSPLHPKKAEGYANTYGQIKRLGLHSSDLPTSLSSLSSIFKKYEKKVIKKQRLLDPENIILKAIAVLQKVEKTPPISVITIDGYFDFSPLQSLFIEALQRAGVRIEVYVPANESFAIVEQTVKELKQIGFTDKRTDMTAICRMEDEQYVQATTETEQWRGVMENILEKELPFSQVGILVVDEKNGIKQLERFAKMYNVPLNRAQKRPVSTTAIYTFLLYMLRQPTFHTRWERLSLVEHILRLYQVTGLSYVKQKELFLQSGTWLSETHEQLFHDVISFRESNKEDNFITFLQKLLDFITQLPIILEWEEQILMEENIEKLQQMATEYNAWQMIVAEIERTKKQLTERGLTSVILSKDLAYDWFLSLGEQLQIFKERANKRGVSVYSWRDVGLFRGEKLYVVGMNEGAFPKRVQLNGYVHERDLLDCDIRFSPPTQSHMRKKQQAYFKQLKYIAPFITYTYVGGVDAQNPMYPSSFIAHKTYHYNSWSWEQRVQKEHTFTNEHKEEAIAYFVGKGYDVQTIPTHLAQVHRAIERLYRAEEFVPITKRNNTFTITQLESYAKCPFRYALDRKLQVKELLEKRDEISPLDIGQFVHTVIAKLYKKAKLIGIPFGEVSAGKLEKIPPLLDEIFQDEWKKVEQTYPELSRLHFVVKKKRLKHYFYKWWQAERKHFWDNTSLAHMKIEAIEHPISLPITFTNGKAIKLTGQVDRVDFSNDRFVVYDYKLGHTMMRMNEMEAGVQLQLPLYAYAIHVKTQKTADGATYISLRRDPATRAGNGVWKPEYVGNKSPYFVTNHCKNKEERFGEKQFLEKYSLLDRLQHLWEGMHNDFSVKPLDCFKGCPYRAVCRVTPEQEEKYKL